MCLMAALTAPHSLWPRTMTRDTPSSATPYSMLPLTGGPAALTTLPATRTTKRSPTPWSITALPAAELSRLERARRLAVLAWRDPEDGPIAAAARTDGVDRDDVDPLLGELGHEPRPFANPVGPAHQKGALRSGDLPLV